MATTTLHRVSLALAAAAVFVLVCHDASAADRKSREALAAGTSVMNDLFSSARFEEAKTALESAIADCGQGCSALALATLHEDLAIVLITGLRNQKKGAAEMKKARSLDPTLPLDPAFTTPEVQAVYDAAGGGAAPTGHGIPQDVVLEDDTGDDDAEEKPKKRKHPVRDPDEEEAPIPGCASNADCEGGSICEAGTCKKPAPPARHSVWMSLGFAQDFAFTSGQNVCSRSNQTDHGYTCIRGSGGQYHGTPASGGAGSLSGPSLGPSRLALSSEFALGGSWAGGIRISYAFAGGSPTPDGGKAFVPIAGEVHGAYFLGEALSTKSTGVFFEGAFGMAQLVGHGPAHIHENTAAPRPSAQLDNPENQTVTVYQSSGLGFGAAGAGIFVPFGSATALLADLRLALFFPTPGFALTLGAGFAFGL